MARRSSSSRWSRPATGKQIAALKSHGNYDGKYYSMGRASQAIGGGSAGGGRSSAGGLSGGSGHSSLAPSGVGPSLLIPRLLGLTDGLDPLLEPALGLSPRSRLASSGTGPTRLLSQILDVPDDIDSLVKAALRDADRGGVDGALDYDPVESVLYTLRPDDSETGEPRIVVEAEVVHDQSYDGRPSLQIRLVNNNDHDARLSADPMPQLGARPMLAYRPKWTPVLVRTPAELAEQMRIRWRESLEELQVGVDPRMATFLGSSRGMEPALTVLNSNQSPLSKFVLLQGLMDPEGQIQYKGLGLDASTFAAQIRAANEGDVDALSWLEEVQREEVLTSFAEVTGASLAAEASFRLSHWRQQGMALIYAVTSDSANAGFDFSTVRVLLKDAKIREQLSASIGRSRAGAARLRNFMSDSDYDFSRGYGILEDWFFEETRLFLQARFRQSLPGQFAAALAPTATHTSGHAAIAAEVRRLAASASTDPHDYLPPQGTDLSGAIVRPAIYSDRLVRVPSTKRAERIIQAVRCAIEYAETAGDDDLGTLIVAQEVLGYARWTRDELQAAKQIREAESRRVAAAQRTQDAEQRTETAKLREEEARRSTEAAKDLERIVRRHSEDLALTTGPIAIEEPVPDAVQEAARARLAQAYLWQAAASERLAAAEERERWATAAASAAATPDAEEKLVAERDAAVAEQSDARAEQNAARHEVTSAQSDIDLFARARAEFDDLIRDVREENQRRLRDEVERRRQEEARQAEQRHKRAAEQRMRQEAESARRELATRRQEDVNQRQQDRANTAKKALGPELGRLLALPIDAPFWRRKALARTRASLQQDILSLQAEIVGPLVPPRTRWKTWPNLLSRNERYLGTVKKLADYGTFVSLPAGADGLLCGSEAHGLSEPGQLVVVEIVDMPYGKPIVLKRISD